MPQKDSVIYVTRPSLPPLEEYIKYLEDIWQNKWITNNGKYHKMLEKELADFLGVEYISLFVNGTLALISALQVLRITGEVITTPYSFVASAHALLWNDIKPVFVDIEPVTMNLDPVRKNLTSESINWSWNAPYASKVILTSECPSRRETTPMLQPFISITVVAKVFLAIWVVRCFSILFHDICKNFHCLLSPKVTNLE